MSLVSSDVRWNIKPQSILYQKNIVLMQYTYFLDRSTLRFFVGSPLSPAEMMASLKGCHIDEFAHRKRLTKTLYTLFDYHLLTIDQFNLIYLNSTKDISEIKF